MATITRTQRGFAVKCILCGQDESVRIDAHDMNTFHCSQCDEDFTGDDVRAEMAKWAKLLAFIDLAPAIDED